MQEITQAEQSQETRAEAQSVDERTKLVERKSGDDAERRRTDFNAEDIMVKSDSIIKEHDEEDHMKKSLLQLRNTSLGVLFIVNIMWFLLLYTVEIAELGFFIKETRAFQLLFLSVYAFIMVIQFFMMLCHRLITFAHYIGPTQ